jgi:hypothetical protein
MAQRHPRRGAGGAESGGVKDFRPGSAGAVEKKDLTSGVHASARGEREGANDGRREIKKKTYFCKYANDVRAERLGPACGLRPAGEDRGQREPAGPKAEWTARSAGPKVKKKDF